MRIFILSLICFFLSAPVWAHSGHSHGATGSGSSAAFYSVGRTKPMNHVGFVFDVSSLDDDVGEIYSFQLNGEWAFHKRWSVLGVLPVTVLSRAASGVDSGIGDMGVGGKFLFYDGKSFFAFLNSLWRLPSGNADNALGGGVVSQELSLYSGIKISSWTIFFSPGISVSYDNSVDPILRWGTGVSSPFFWQIFYASLAIDAQIFLDSDVFRAGSYKIHVGPQLSVELGHKRQWTISVSPRVSVADGLKLKPGMVLTRADDDLLSDVQWGVSSSVSFCFK